MYTQMPEKLVHQFNIQQTDTKTKNFTNTTGNRLQLLEINYTLCMAYYLAKLYRIRAKFWISFLDSMFNGIPKVFDVENLDRNGKTPNSHKFPCNHNVTSRYLSTNALPSWNRFITQHNCQKNACIPLSNKRRLRT